MTLARRGYAGGGEIQFRFPHLNVGFANNPEEVNSTLYGQVFSATRYFANEAKLLSRTSQRLSQTQYERITTRVNSAGLGSDHRWSAYQRALNILGN